METPWTSNVVIIGNAVYGEPSSFIGNAGDVDRHHSLVTPYTANIVIAGNAADVERRHSLATPQTLNVVIRWQRRERRTVIIHWQRRIRRTASSLATPQTLNVVIAGNAVNVEPSSFADNAVYVEFRSSVANDRRSPI